MSSLVEIGSVVLENFFKYFVNVFSLHVYFVIISLWKKGGYFHLNKVEFPSHKESAPDVDKSFVCICSWYFNGCIAIV